MRCRVGSSVPFLSSLILLFATLGCGKSGPQPAAKPGDGATAAESAVSKHEHAHATPDISTFPEGVAALQEHHQEIKEAFAKRDMEMAHEPLHHVGEILELLPELGKKAGLSSDDLAKLSPCVEAMFQAYSKIDDAMHRNKEPDYQAVADQLDQNMATIAALRTPPPAAK